MGDGFVDPIVQLALAIRESTQAALQAAAHEPPPAPPEINLTITMPPLDVRVENAVNPTPVHNQIKVSPTPIHNTVSAPPVHVNADTPAVHVQVPTTPGAKEIVFSRDKDGRITGASVKETGG